MYEGKKEDQWMLCFIVEELDLNKKNQGTA